MVIENYMEGAMKYKVGVGCFEGVEAEAQIAEHLSAVIMKHVDHVKPFVELKILL